MNDTVKVSNETYNDTGTIYSQLYSEKQNAVNTFQNTLNFLSFAMNKRNVSKQQYSTIHDQFIR